MKITMYTTDFPYEVPPDGGAGGLIRRAVLSRYTKLYLPPAFKHSARIIALSEEAITSSPHRARQRARMAVEGRSWTRIAEQTEALYQEIA